MSINKRFAVLIDAENISADYLEGILSEIAEYGIASYKRMYGDFTNAALGKWNEKAIEHSIVQIQQPRYSSKAKNSSDIMLVIDAMDILHDNHVEGFCIVSSDSDFTRLVNRLSEGGMEVIGMGKRDASRSLKAACTEYKNLDILIEEEASEEQEEEEQVRIVEPSLEILRDERVEDEPEDVKGDSNIELKVIKNAIRDIIIRKEAKGKTTGLGEIGSQLVKTYPDFDIRNYGYKSLTIFVEDLNEFQVVKEGTAISVRITDNVVSKEEIEAYLKKILGRGQLPLSAAGSKIHEKYSGFRVQDYGYTKFERFLCSFPNMEVQTDDANNKQKIIRIRTQV